MDMINFWLFLHNFNPALMNQMCKQKKLIEMYNGLKFYVIFT